MACRQSRRPRFRRACLCCSRGVQRSPELITHRAKNSRLRAIARSGANRFSGESGQYQQWDFQSPWGSRRRATVRARILSTGIRLEMDCAAGCRWARGPSVRRAKGHAWQAAAAMRTIVADHLPGTTASITFEDGNPAMPPTKGNLALLALQDTVSRALGLGPVEALDPGRRGGGDISYVSDYLDALDGLGVKGMRSHTPDERVDLRSIVPATERAALLIYRLTRQR
ncbi:MAG TPA: M20/M25/M40 family metallo-hydrolase [Gemmatimonadaceae bacterium]